MKEKCILNNIMDLSIPGSTNAPLSTAAIFADNVQDLLGTGTLQVRPSAKIVVNSIDDALNSSPGVTTLRDAINKANADSQKDLIVFDRSLFSTAQTITLKLGELDITHNLDIIAPRDTLTGEDLVTVSGNQASRVFEIEQGATVTFERLIVTQGRLQGSLELGSLSVFGAGIFNHGTLTLNSSIVLKNNAIPAFRDQEFFGFTGGGGIANGGPTQTIALLPGSPAINAADPTILPTDPTTDQRGRLRTRRGRADIGAFESSLRK